MLSKSTDKQICTALVRGALDADLAAGRPIAAVDRLAMWLDDRMYAGEFSLIETLLGELDPRLYPPEVSTAALALTGCVSARVNPGRERLLSSLEEALVGHWEVEESVARATLERLTVLASLDDQ